MKSWYYTIKYLEKKTDSLKDSSDKTSLKEQLTKLTENIEIADSEQKLTETQFPIPDKKITDLKDEDYDTADTGK